MAKRGCSSRACANPSRSARIDGNAARSQHAIMHLGTCYYPEHWPEDWWADDARRMRDMGLSRIRIGEFAWSRIEPARGAFDWGWLDRAIETLHGEGLGIILGTPTATPPKWLVDEMPGMIAIDTQGRPRKFGSRRHYCFSHPGYRAECARIVTVLAERYGDHPAIVMWQTDNEYGCHDSAISYSDAAASAFRTWLSRKYADVAALNTAWGNVFWSMEYPSFAVIDPPNLTVTEPNPAHVLDWRRFASDEVVSFNRLQCDIIRGASPGRDITHNFMGFFTQFDHAAVARDLDLVTWDSYPLGFLDSFSMFTEEEKLRYARQGHPDIAAFHHDLYRGMAKGARWGVMEQQPGPVNWARHNPAPLPGMVRLWTLEALAHGAELVSYFRWRQAPFAQEQMHAGLNRPDRSEDVGGREVRQVAQDLKDNPTWLSLSKPLPSSSTAALIFSYEAAWVFDAQPQGASFKYLDLVLAFYSALRRAGLNVDIVSPDVPLDGYAMVVVPSLPIVAPGTFDSVSSPVLFGPRTGSKTTDFAIPARLPPDLPIPIKVVRVESLRAGLVHEGNGVTVKRWIEHIESNLMPEIATGDGTGIVWKHNKLRYLSAWPDEALLDTLVARMTAEAGLAISALPRDVRLRHRGDFAFAFNYGPHAVEFEGRTLPPAGVAVWRVAE
jgi:beta-galactosidase